ALPDRVSPTGLPEPPEPAGSPVLVAAEPASSLASSALKLPPGLGLALPALATRALPAPSPPSDLLPETEAIRAPASAALRNILVSITPPRAEKVCERRLVVKRRSQGKVAPGTRYFRYRCFLPDLAGFTAVASPGTINVTQAAEARPKPAPAERRPKPERSQS